MKLIRVFDGRENGAYEIPSYAPVKINNIKEILDMAKVACLIKSDYLGSWVTFNADENNNFTSFQP